MSRPPIESEDAPRAAGSAHGLLASRRRLLLKGIGRGGALLAGAAVPIRTLAAIPSVTASGRICSISGVQSAVHSGPTSLPTCAGRMPVSYAEVENWPYGDTTYTVGLVSFDKTSKFQEVFGTSPNGNALLKNILKLMPSSDEAHWIAALFNAIRPPPGYEFPYSPSEVLDLYHDPARSDAALAFFKGYMETLA